MKMIGTTGAGMCLFEMTEVEARAVTALVSSVAVLISERTVVGKRKTEDGRRKTEEGRGKTGAEEAEPDRVCPGCGEMFVPPRTVPGARFCREAECQRKMKVEYQRKYRARERGGEGKGKGTDGTEGTKGTEVKAERPAGVERVRVALRRIALREDGLGEGGLPRENGRTLPVGIDGP